MASTEEKVSRTGGKVRDEEIVALKERECSKVRYAKIITVKEPECSEGRDT